MTEIPLKKFDELMAEHATEVAEVILKKSKAFQDGIIKYLQEHEFTHLKSKGYTYLMVEHSLPEPTIMGLIDLQMKLVELLDFPKDTEVAAFKRGICEIKFITPFNIPNGHEVYFIKSN